MSRTRLQRDADEIDLAMHRLARRIEAEAAEHKIPEWHDVASKLYGLRYEIRKRMSEQDRKATA